MRGPARGAYFDGKRNQGSPLRSRGPAPDRAKLAGLRVIQRDLVYVIGIPSEIAQEEQLARYDYFGQYGQIKKIAVNHQISYATHQRCPTVSAYVTFYNVDDAWECIFALENFSLNGHPIKASFGTTKYCSSFLSGQTKCNNPDCMYLHVTGDPEDSFEREEIDQNSPRFVNLTRPSRPPDYFSYPFKNQKPAKFPFRRLITRPDAIPAPPPAQALTSGVKEDVVKDEEREKKNLKSEFLASLWNCTRACAEPLKVDYVVGKSLTEQLGLGRPTIRSVYQAANLGLQ
jgi:RNA recognition motif-containing protein